MAITQHNDLNEILNFLREGLTNIIGDNLIGLYLTGSLAYGDFDRGSSDIDFLAVLQHILSNEKLQEVESLHLDIGKKYPKWQKRIEGSYVTKKMLLSIEPPKQSRPYFNANKLSNLRYGDEWILNLYELYKHGIALIGPNFRELIKSVDIADAREASKKNLLEEWQLKIKSPRPFETDGYDSSHLQAYAVLTMCRILYLANNEDVVSKKVAATWVKDTYRGQWAELVEKAENWQHGKEMSLEDEVRKFIKFVVDEVGEK